MQFGYFAMPSHPPERPLKAGHDWDLQTLRWLDTLGYTEAWIGEHHTAPWEPHPAPDLLIAQALLQTDRIRIGPGGFLLPYHHPAELANRIGMLDHLSGRSPQFRRRRLRSALRLGDVPCRWHVGHQPRDDARGARNHPAPLVQRDAVRLRGQILVRLQTRHSCTTRSSRISARCSSRTRRSASPDCPKTPTRLKLAGEHGFLPLSLNLNPAYVASHWEAVEIGAQRAGRTPRRADWRLVREVFVAETDAEAWRLSVGGMMGRMMREYFLPLLGNFGFLDYLKHDPDVPDSDVTVEYCARQNWLIGSPATVAEKLARVYEEVGGFGQILVFGFDYADNAAGLGNLARDAGERGLAQGRPPGPDAGGGRSRKPHEPILHRAGSPPPVAVGGEGIRLHLADGRAVIDASGGAAVACLGHGNRRVAEAIGRQAATMAYAHTGAFSSEPAEATGRPAAEGLPRRPCARVVLLLRLRRDRGGAQARAAILHRDRSARPASLHCPPAELSRHHARRARRRRQQDAPHASTSRCSARCSATSRLASPIASRAPMSPMPNMWTV